MFRTSAVLFFAMPLSQVHFLTGRLAEKALRETLPGIAAAASFEFTVQVMPITVAALMTPSWIAKHIKIPAGTDRVIIPGFCEGDLESLERKFEVKFQRGPKDLRNLPEFFGGKRRQLQLDRHSIDIVAEINHVPFKTVDQVVAIAQGMAASGADYIDIGCVPDQRCREIGDYVAAVKDLGLKVSIDSWDREEVGDAVVAGAELILSVNSTNREAALDWGVEVVVVPDEITDIASMESTIDWLDNHSIPFRIDPVLEPVGLGFADSLARYHAAAKRWPKAEMMMGVGNLTELSDVDSAGINFLLLGFCQELNITSVLTTEVINWARSSVAELDIARRIVQYSCDNRVPPKNISNQLVALRDARLVKIEDQELETLADQIKDHNYRIFSAESGLHVLSAGQKISAEDPFEIFDALVASEPKNLNPSHSFYLGFELCKAMIANQLGKNYVQDEALNWGHLTVEEGDRHRLTGRGRKKQQDSPS